MSTPALDDTAPETHVSSTTRMYVDHIALHRDRGPLPYPMGPLANSSLHQPYLPQRSGYDWLLSSPRPTTRRCCVAALTTYGPVAQAYTRDALARHVARVFPELRHHCFASRDIVTGQRVPQKRDQEARHTGSVTTVTTCTSQVAAHTYQPRLRDISHIQR